MSRRHLSTVNPDVISVRGRGDFRIYREYAFDQAACIRAVRLVLDATPKTSTPEPEAVLAEYPELSTAG